MKQKELIAEMDGNKLCIKRRDFINLQESPAIFIKLSKEQIKEMNKITNTIEEE